MAEKGGNKILVIITICIMLISIGFIGCVEEKKDNENNDIEGYTGFENVDKAFEQAQNETNNVKLRLIQCFNHISNGIFKRIKYGFSDIRFDNVTNQFFSYASIDIYFEYGKEPYKSIFPEVYPDPDIFKPLSEINITTEVMDCDGAYKIAINNPIIKQYIKNSEKAYSLDFEGATIDILYTWSFRWFCQEKKNVEGGKIAYIKIDAKSGEVIEVSADGFDP